MQRYHNSHASNRTSWQKFMPSTLLPYWCSHSKAIRFGKILLLIVGMWAFLYITFDEGLFKSVSSIKCWICDCSELAAARNKGRRQWWLGNTTRNLSIWPEDDPESDRIINQIQFVPTVKTILMYQGIQPLALSAGDVVFRGCMVKTCFLSEDRSIGPMADAVFFRQHSPQNIARPADQIWIINFAESPLNTNRIAHPYASAFNWTATYRIDSDLVVPYDMWVYYDKNVKQQARPLKNYATNKTKKVAWFVSNCASKNSRSLYALSLSRYIRVDIIGKCGYLKCPKSSKQKCFQKLKKDYKFYLSFENSNCKDYITEKFFTNALQNDVVPIVMGARREDYQRVAPFNSFIHVDDFDSPKQLAEYLKKLDNDDTLYNSYFLWKGTGEFRYSDLFCRLCALLHSDYPRKWYSDINYWWFDKEPCTPAPLDDNFM